MNRFACLTIFSLMLGAATIVAAQDCPTLVESALETAYALCSETGRNSACYGNKYLTITPRPNVRLAQFAEPGDVAPLAALEKIELGSQIDADEWGIALLQIQADLPDTTPGQNVTMVLFGAVSLENAAAPADASPATPEAPAYTPMQAFYFASGIGDRPCDEAPDSGILVQTPEGATTISLNANGVEIEMGSTLYLQAANGRMRISVIEGSARVIANGVTRLVLAGMVIDIALTPDGHAPDGTPNMPQPYDDAPLQTLPVGGLPEIIIIAPPAEAAAVPDAGSTYQTTFSYVLVDACADWELAERNDYEAALSFAEDGAVMNLGSFVYSRAGVGSYTYQEIFGEPGNQTVWDYTVRLTAPGNFEGEIVATWNFSTCVPRYVINGTYSTTP